MSRPGQAVPLRVVHPDAGPVDELLAALEDWAVPCPGDEPVAYLEAGDGELRDGFPLSAAKVAELVSLLRRATKPRGSAS